MATRDTDPAVAGFEPGVALPARVYNVWLGGKDHFAPDRDAAQKVAGCRPQVVAGARANRQFLGRVVRYLAGTRGIGQFLDIGPGYRPRTTFMSWPRPATPRPASSTPTTTRSCWPTPGRC